jgi:hypothetical protein
MVNISSRDHFVVSGMMHNNEAYGRTDRSAAYGILDTLYMLRLIDGDRN